MRTFHVVFRPEPEGGFTAIVPSLPGCITYGETLEEAEVMAQAAIDLYIETLDPKEIPHDDSRSFLKTLSHA